MTAYFHNGQLLFNGGKIATSEDCCCGDVVDVCSSGDPSAWKVTLAIEFETCDPPPFGYLDPSALNGTYELPYEFGVFSSGAAYTIAPTGTTPKHGCRSANGYWAVEGFRVFLRCDTDEWSISALVATTNTLLVAGFGLVTADQQGGGALEAGTTYILTPNDNDPLSGIANPARATSCTVTITAV